MSLTSHQQHQLAVINQIAAQVQQQRIQFSMVAPVVDFARDPRLALTGVHLPQATLINQIQQQLIAPLRKTEPNLYFYPDEALHITVKNVRTVSDPPHFVAAEIQKAQQVFAAAVPRHQKYRVYFERLLLFPNNLALIATTDPQLDDLVLDLNQSLQAAGIGDDKIYPNDRYFFANMTLARFNQPVSVAFKQKVLELSAALALPPYEVDSVTLLTCNAVLTKRRELGTWKLQG